MRNVLCTVISGATAAAIKTAFETWRNAFEGVGNLDRAEVVCCTMFGTTDLIVFYYLEHKPKIQATFSKHGSKT
jgi:hypothetical protein